ncbi:hypothetical protein L53_02660 [Hyphomonas sp. L-53-1-40]|nr:hypothetical protein L53_02660 [Hyphomonas sp. L-53-1-40]
MDRKPTAAEEILAELASFTCVLIFLAVANAGLFALLRPLNDSLAWLSLPFLWGGLLAQKFAVAPRPSIIGLWARPIKMIFLNGRST